MNNACWCDRTKADHRESVWQPSWGARHKWDNQRSSGSPLKPMLAQNADKDKVLALIRETPEEWSIERKYDGLRAIVSIHDNVTEIFSRTGMPLNETFPELTQQHMYFDNPNLILDGEIVTIPEDLDTLQLRMGLTKPEDVMPMTMKYPVQIIFFDVLRMGDADLTTEPYWYRRSHLEILCHEGNDRPTSEMVTFHELESVFDRGWEGCVVKRRDSLYHPGKRRADWKKYKLVTSQDLVVTGTKPGKGQKEGRIGSFEMSFWDKEKGSWLYVGNVGAGLITEEKLKLEQIVETVPMNTVVLEVAFMRPTAKQGLMREPRIIRVRSDKLPEDCDQYP